MPIRAAAEVSSVGCTLRLVTAGSAIGMAIAA
jgi:hypothetical protein